MTLLSCCISYHFYIKPQPDEVIYGSITVVYLIISTSNHNLKFHQERARKVVYLIISTSNHNSNSLRSNDVGVVYLIISTSNHNVCFICFVFFKLYILSFLHQTTTSVSSSVFVFCCISYHFYIKPQLCDIHFVKSNCCISYHFYIKPQRYICFHLLKLRCISYHFYIKPQRCLPLLLSSFRCISYHFYIKPQLPLSNHLM